MKKTIIAFIITLALLLSVAVIVPFLPMDYFKDTISRGVKNATGRELIIKGAIRFHLFPSFSATVHDITLVNPPGFSQGPMITISEIQLDTHHPLSFFTKMPVVDQITVSDPIFFLEKNAAGEGNWQLRHANSAQKEIGTPTKHEPLLFMLSRFMIRNGQVHYTHNNQLQSLSDINAKLILSAVDYSLEGIVSMQYEQHFINNILLIKTPQNLFTGEDTDISISISDNDAKIVAEGSLAITPQKIHLSHSRFKAGTMQVTGDVEINTSVSPINIHADIKGEKLATAAPLLPSANNVTSPSQPIAKERWNRTPFHLDFMKNVNGSVTYSGPITTSALQIEDGQISINLSSGNLTLVGQHLHTAGGSSDITFSLNNNALQLIFKCLLKMDNVSLPQLFPAWHRIDGKGTATMNLTAKGNSEYDLINSLSGNGFLSVDHGNIRGIKGLNIIPHLTDAQENVPFDRVSGSFTVSNGTVHNDDMKLIAPSLTLAGNGTINLPLYTLSYHLTPTSKMVKDLASGDIGVMLTGNIDTPFVTVDASNYIKKNLPKLENAVKKLREDAKSKLLKLMDKF